MLFFPCGSLTEEELFIGCSPTALKHPFGHKSRVHAYIFFFWTSYLDSLLTLVPVALL